ncbi:hypothetical protein CDAR_467731 [Caerostris darwini]|uniref:Uncharacterized protein n=1 Tax=Caerostris darwini TaxID=1538125 RepID=A0AAV4SP93_9ARAC|nr:hypothetical protein CDAR_467731 [Caerostris darwini]
MQVGQRRNRNQCGYSFTEGIPTKKSEYKNLVLKLKPISSVSDLTFIRSPHQRKDMEGEKSRKILSIKGSVPTFPITGGKEKCINIEQVYSFFQKKLRIFGARIKKNSFVTDAVFVQG